MDRIGWESSGICNTCVILKAIIAWKFSIFLFEVVTESQRSINHRSRSMDPTADVLLPRISCSLSIRVRSSIWVVAEGGLSLCCVVLRTEDRRLPVLMKMKNSSCSLGLVVILCFIRVLSTRKGCTMLTFI